MKYTLLELVQVILSSMDSDEVNSISDTTEATQVAHVVRTAFYDLIERLGLTEHRDLFQLTASGNALKPVLMTRPTDVNSIDWVKYNKVVDGETDPDFQLVQYLPPDVFLDQMHSLSLSDANVLSFDHTVGSDTFTLLYINDKAPEYWTSWDDYTLIFDSYDADVDTTLQKAKTLCLGVKSIPFTLTDGFTPDLDDSQFAMLLNEAKALAWAELKQTQHAKAERNSRNHQIHALKKKTAAPTFYTALSALPHYGRK
jgi:hypothetical protein